MPSFNKCASQFQPITQERAQISDLTNEWVKDREKMKVKTLNLYSSNELNYILGHKKVDKAKIPKIILFYIKWQIKTLIKRQKDVIPFLGWC